MKNMNAIFFMATVIGFLFYSCNKEEETPLDNTLASSVVGMNTQHNQNDIHFGGFNPNMNSCIYKFSIQNNSNYFEVFEGVK